MKTGTTTMADVEGAALARGRLSMRAISRDVLLWTVFLAVDGGTQIAFKLGGTALEGIDFGGAWFDRAMSTPAIWLAIAGYLVAFVLWIAILQDNSLTRAFTLTGVSFATVPLAGAFIFHEQVSYGRAAGIALIIVGVTLITRPAPATGSPEGTASEGSGTP